MINTKELFAKNLNTFMKHYDLSQARLGEKIGYSSSAVGDWCRGEKFPHLDTVDKLSRIFHCTLGDLLEREMQEDKIEERARLVRLYAYMERLNPNGVEKALTFFEDLNPKFYEVEEDVQ